jgi:antitoxin PrlF
MAAVEAKITSKGQITLPSHVRRRLKVGPGDSVMFVEGRDGRIVVRSKMGTLADMKGLLRDKARSQPAGMIDDWVSEARSRNWPKPQTQRRAR